MRRPALMFVLAGLVGALVAVPIAVYAAHSFNDVPDSNTFHEDIAWLRGAGVTLGCNPPANDEFCPKDEVTREQMSAFMHRLAENQVVDAGALEGYTAAELSSDGYSVFRDIEEPVGNGPSSQTVVELSGLPAGSYIIVAKTLMRNAAGTSNVTCELVAAPDFDRVIATVPSAYYVPMTMTVVHTFADNDGSAVLQCQDGATSIMSSWSKISAISVDSLSNSSG